MPTRHRNARPERGPQPEPEGEEEMATRGGAAEPGAAGGSWAPRPRDAEEGDTPGCGDTVTTSLVAAREPPAQRPAVGGYLTDPPTALVHVALLVTQLSFGGGSVVGKFGVHGTNPVLFALIREGIAGPLLCIAGTIFSPELPERRDLGRIAFCGVCIWANQLCFIVGLKLADATTGSVWQPSQPVFTAALAILMGFEVFRWRVACGLGLAIGGACFMVLYGQEAGGGSFQALGHVLFFFNCLGTSGYVIASKPLFGEQQLQGDGVACFRRYASRRGHAGDEIRHYAPLSVTGWGYLAGSALMAATAVTVTMVPPMLDFVCHDSDSSVKERCTSAPWHVPKSMIWCLAYWIAGNSILAYGSMTWANKFAKASIVSAYTVLQPVTSATISYLIVAIQGKNWADDYGLEEPGIKDLGILGIILGLGLVLSAGRTLVTDEAPHRAAGAEGAAPKQGACLALPLDPDLDSSCGSPRAGHCNG
eukprot:TRINITY_DN28630_c0_g1_i1.p1 TRINITY_DN28630_c0_g1~~TRINITY_DN28630_c0_g1_i1.p1  ORF type:complete len:497 (+),score=104.60 TRINITY_DN28630_c0_g1_i1:60-1493(+)